MSMTMRERALQQYADALREMVKEPINASAAIEMALEAYELNTQFSEDLCKLASMIHLLEGDRDSTKIALGRKIEDYQKLEKVLQDTEAELAAARAEAEQARRDGQEQTAGLHEKLGEVRAELAAVKRQRDELLEAAKLAIREIRPSTDCSMCHDSTWDHECDSKINPTHVALSNAIKKALAAERAGDPDNPLIGDEGFRLRDWPEDSAFENGNYQNTCINCSRGFVGHKRRVVCRQCHIASEGT